MSDISIDDKVTVEEQEYIAKVIGKLGLEDYQLKLPNGNIVWKNIDEIERCE